MWKKWFYCPERIGERKEGISTICNTRYTLKPTLYPWIFCGGSYCLKTKSRKNEAKIRKAK